MAPYCCVIMKKVSFLLISGMLLIACKQHYNSQAVYFYNKGLIDDSLKNYKQEIKDNTEAINLEPDFVDAYDNRGNAKFMSGDFSSAIHDYNKAIELDPNCASAYSNRGVAKTKNGGYKDAIFDFDKAIELDSTNPNFYWNRAKYGREAYKERIADLSKTIELEPNNKNAYLTRGLEEYIAEYYTAAIDDFDRAIKLEVDSNKRELAIEYCYRGMSKFGYNYYSAAIIDIDKAAELDSILPIIYLNRGYVKIKSEDKKGSCLDFYKAKELGDTTALDSIKKYCH